MDAIKEHEEMAPTYPYVNSVPRLLEVFEHFRAKRIPETVDSSNLKKLGLAAGSESYVVKVLGFLELIDSEGVFSPVGRALFLKGDPEFGIGFGKIVRDSYSPLVGGEGDRPWEKHRDDLVALFRQVDGTVLTLAQSQVNLYKTLSTYATEGQKVQPAKVSAPSVVQSTSSVAGRAKSDSVSGPRSKSGVPRVGLAEAERYAQGVWTAARDGSGPHVSVARVISNKDDAVASGGRWRAIIATLRAYGLAESDATGIRLTAGIGLGIVKTHLPEERRASRQKAMLFVDAFRRVLEKYDGHELASDAALAGIFEFEYSLANATAMEVSRAFRSSVEFADFLDEEGVVQLGEYRAALSNPVEDDVIEFSELLESDLSDVINDPQERPASDGAVSKQALASSKRPRRGETVDGATTVSDLSIQMDLSNWEVDDVIRVLTFLGFGHHARS